MAILTNLDVRIQGNRIEYTITLIGQYGEIPFPPDIVGKNVRLIEVTDRQQPTLYGYPVVDSMPTRDGTYIPLQNHNKLAHIQEGIHAIDKLLDDGIIKKREVKNSITELEL